MVATRGLGSEAGGSGGGEPVRVVILDDEVHELIAVEVAAAVRGAIPEMFGSVDTTLIELVDECYTAVMQATAVAATAVVASIGARVGESFQYRDFSNTKPTKFYRVKDPILAMRWLSNMDGCFFMCSYPQD